MHYFPVQIFFSVNICPHGVIQGIAGVLAYILPLVSRKKWRGRGVTLCELCFSLWMQPESEKALVCRDRSVPPLTFPSPGDTATQGSKVTPCDFCSTHWIY